MQRGRRGRPRTRPDRVRADRACSSRATETACGDAGSPLSFRNRLTRPAIVNAGVHVADGHQPLTPKITRGATFWANFNGRQAMARSGWPLRQTRHRLPRGGSPTRHHPLATPFIRHALVRPSSARAPAGLFPSDRTAACCCCAQAHAIGRQGGTRRDRRYSRKMRAIVAALVAIDEPVVQFDRQGQHRTNDRMTVSANAL